MSNETASGDLVDVTSFDAVQQCESGHEFELTNLDSSGTGLHLRVQGRHSREVSSWISRLMREQAKDAQAAMRRGKAAEIKSLDDLMQQNIEGAAVRAIGWRGAKQSFDRDLLKVALKRNPHWIAQIVNASDDDASFFTKAQPTT